MVVFLTGAVLFVIAFVIHVIAWNICVPRHQATVLLLIFLTIGIVGALGVSIFGGSEDLSLSPLRFALAVLLYLSACTTYLLLFSAIEAETVTFTLIRLIRRNGSRGISYEQLVQEMANHSFVRPRLQQMIDNGILVQVHDRLFVGPRGRLLAGLVLYYRKLLGKRQAGG